MSLVLDATAIKDELQGLLSVIQTQTAIVKDFSDMITRIHGSDLSTSTGVALLKKTNSKLQEYEVELRKVKEDTGAIEYDVSSELIITFHSSDTLALTDSLLCTAFTLARSQTKTSQPTRSARSCCSG